MSLDQNRRAPRRAVSLTLLPLVVFGALAALFLARLFAGDASRIPSALIGQSAPALDLPGLEGAAGLKDADLRQGHVTVVNIFGVLVPAVPRGARGFARSCRGHGAGGQGRAADRRSAEGRPENVRRFLGAKGDPYAKVALDRDGRAGIDWGVYGVPETFIVKGDGTVAFKFIGPMNAEALASVVRPQIEKAMN